MKYLVSTLLCVSILSVSFGQAPTQPASHDHQAMTKMPEQMATMNQMIPGYLGGKDRDFDRRFIDMMIPHHEGAIIAAKQVLAESDRPELKEAAQKMIEAQQAEVEQLKRWRAEWYGK